MKTLDRKSQNVISKDWLSEFPDFKQYKPMLLIRRNGPVLCGFDLRTTSSKEDYEPTFFIHGLMIEAAPVMSMGSVFTSLTDKGARDYVRICSHEKDFRDASLRIKKSISPLQKASLSLYELIEFIKKQESYKYYSSYEFEIIILLLFYYGKVDKAEKELENALSIISRWDNSTWLIRFLGVKGWDRKMRNLMNKDTLQENINKEIVKYKLEEFIDYRLIDNK